MSRHARTRRHMRPPMHASTQAHDTHNTNSITMQSPARTLAEPVSLELTAPRQTRDGRWGQEQGRGHTQRHEPQPKQIGVCRGHRFPCADAGVAQRVQVRTVIRERRLTARCTTAPQPAKRAIGRVSTSRCVSAHGSNLSAGPFAVHEKHQNTPAQPIPRFNEPSVWQGPTPPCV